MFYTSLVEFFGRTNITIRTSDSQASPWTSKADGQSSKEPVHHRHEGAGERQLPENLGRIYTRRTILGHESRTKIQMRSSACFLAF